MGKGKLKKHVKLYNAVWQALHADDAFVVTSKLDYAELVAYLGKALQAAAARSGYSLIYFADVVKPGRPWDVLAEGVLMALQVSEAQVEFVRGEVGPELAGLGITVETDK